MPTKRRDITGMRSGSLVAIAPHHADARSWFWTVRCDCGTEKILRSSVIVAGKLKSCGCGPRRGGDATGRRKHLFVGTPTYRTWASMIQRCTNPDSSAYQYYGATGISVCPQWFEFTTFLSDMGERPPGKTIDRYPDPAGNYQPGNCRWATKSQQANNRRQWGTIAPKKYPQTLTVEERKYRSRQLYNSAMHPKQIAKILGVSITTVWNDVKD